MKENEEEQTPNEPVVPIDMDVAMDAARELSPEFLIRSAEILNGSLTEAQRENEMRPLLAEFNRRVNAAYQRKLKETASGRRDPTGA